MVLGGDGHAAGPLVADGMVASPVAELELGVVAPIDRANNW
jgi:hypothetical protein